MKRGALIVIEGIDRTGKSTQAKTLVDSLKRNNVAADYTNFPARETEVGKVIDSYLQRKKDLPDNAIHLLFSANRWEKAKQILETLKSGVTVIIDRYCYSGVAFSAAKGLDIYWCKSSDVGLPKPDKVFFLTMPFDNVIQRDGFGNERYEVLNFQKKVSELYLQLKEDNWEVLDANRPIEVIQEELLTKTLKITREVCNKPVGKMWSEL